MEGAQAGASPLSPLNEIAVDPDGNVYFASSTNNTGNAIYRISAAGIVNRIAGAIDAVPYSDDAGPALGAFTGIRRLTPDKR